MANDNQDIIDKSKALLNDLLEMYKDAYSQEEGKSCLINEKYVDRNNALSTIKDNYNFTLEGLKKLGVDVSAFSNSLEESVKQMETKKLTSLEHINKLADFVVENDLPLQKVMEVYSEFNDRIYNNYTHKVGGVKSDSSDLEDKAFKLTVRYFSIEKAKKSKGCSTQ
jgi:hypothetical protein